LKSAASGKPASARRRTLDRAAWVGAARGELLRGGIAAVKIGRLARRLGATRGSFYWHFADRDDLLRELLVDWEASNTAPFERILAEGSNGIAEFEAVVELWLAEKEYNPAYDTAVRGWARIDPVVAAAVRRADERRIDVLRRIFVDLGFRDPEALVRARITYFHQVGYYTLGLAEEPARRRELLPLYVQALVGRPLAAGAKR